VCSSLLLSLFADRLFFRQEVPQAIEALLPPDFAIVDPALGCAEPIELEVTRSDAAHLLRADDPRGLQQLDVLDHGSERHGERGGELAYRRRSPAQPLQHGATCRVREGVKHAIEGDVTIQHESSLASSDQ
jgi:hypothetical protein